MILFPPAKINLGLNVLGRRSDGYHEIETCMYQIPIHDVLEILPSNTFDYKQSGLFIDGEIEDNLVIKAYRLLQEKYDLPPVYIHLRKNLPMGAGLGGGSSDATYALLGFNTLFDLDISNDLVHDFAFQLGSDCPFFIENKAQIATGRGEKLVPIDVNLKGYFLKLLNPGIHIGTEDAYSNCMFSMQEETIREIVEGPVTTWKDRLFNSFESSVFKQHPSLFELKSSFYEEGAIYASMTGSGSTLFGIYSEKPITKTKDKFERIIRL